MAEMVELGGELADETLMAWKFVAEGNDEENAVWIPKSISEWKYTSNQSEGVITVPVWFAEREGLL